MCAAFPFLAVTTALLSSHAKLNSSAASVVKTRFSVRACVIREILPNSAASVLLFFHFDSTYAHFNVCTGICRDIWVHLSIYTSLVFSGEIKKKIYAGRFFTFYKYSAFYKFLFHGCIFDWECVFIKYLFSKEDIFSFVLNSKTKKFVYL